MVLTVGKRGRATARELRRGPLVRLATVPAVLSSSLDGLRAEQRRGEICVDCDAIVLGSFRINTWEGAVLRADKNSTPFEEL
jgi:hypothetical protein